MRAELERINTLETTFNKYVQQYLERRNNIMFAFKFIIPTAYELCELKLNQSLYLFMLSKATYLELRKVLDALKAKTNLFELQLLWTEFADSYLYQSIQEQIREDLEIVSSHSSIFLADVGTVSEQLTV